MTLLSDISFLLKAQGQDHLCKEIEGFSLTSLKKFYDALVCLPKLTSYPVFEKPDKSAVLPFTNAAIKIGDKKNAYAFLKKNKVAAILLAGGVGSRLDFQGPKGCFPISVIKRKSLFQIHLEKIAILEKSLETELTLFILTSEKTHSETKAFLENFSYFGLAPERILLVQQPSYPVTTIHKKWSLTKEEALFTSPNGNGGLFEAFSHHLDLLEEFEHFMIFPIDNPLCTPFDPELLSFHLEEGSDITLRCCERLLPDEKVGVFCKYLNQVVLVDYNDLEEALFTKKTGEKFYFPYGNPNIFFMKKEFFLTMCANNLLPLHWIEKKINGEIFLKPEKFLTDILYYTSNSSFLLSNRKEHFAPLKSKEGANGISFVQQALLEKDQKLFQKLTQIDPLGKPLELSMEFYFPDKSLIASCLKLKEIPSVDYITPREL